MATLTKRDAVIAGIFWSLGLYMLAINAILPSTRSPPTPLLIGTSLVVAGSYFGGIALVRRQ